MELRQQAREQAARAHLAAERAAEQAARRRTAERALEKAVRSRAAQAERRASQEEQRQRPAAAAVPAATSQIVPSLPPPEVLASACTTQSQSAVTPAASSQPQQPARASDAPAVLNTPLSAATPTTAAESGVSPAVKPAAGSVSEAQAGDGTQPGPTNTQPVGPPVAQSSASPVRSTAAASQAAAHTAAAAPSSSAADSGDTAQARHGAHQSPGIGADNAEPAVGATAQLSVVEARIGVADTQALGPTRAVAPGSLATACADTIAQAEDSTAVPEAVPNPWLTNGRQAARHRKLTRDRNRRSAGEIEDERVAAVQKANTQRRSKGLEVRNVQCLLDAVLHISAQSCLQFSTRCPTVHPGHLCACELNATHKQYGLAA